MKPNFSGVCAILLLASFMSVAEPASQTLGVLPNTGNVKAVSFSPNGKLLADGRYYGLEGEEKKRSDEEQDEFVNNGKHITGPIRLWNVADGRLLRTLW